MNFLWNMTAYALGDVPTVLNPLFTPSVVQLSPSSAPSPSSLPSLLVNELFEKIRESPQLQTHRHSEHLYRRFPHPAGNYAYVVTRRGARKLLAKIERDGCPHAIDDQLLFEFGDYEEYIAVPFICQSPIGYKSDIPIDMWGLH